MLKRWLQDVTVVPEKLAPFAAGFYLIGEICRKTNVNPPPAIGLIRLDAAR